jgi:glycyl-tRNA synthetase
MVSLAKIMELCQRRGWIYPAMGGVEKYMNGIRGLYDYGPLGTMLKKNLMQEWYRDMVLKKRIQPSSRNGHTHNAMYIDILPLETSILGSRSMYEASGHVENFIDPLMDDYLSKERFRPDKAKGVHIDHEEGCHVIKVKAKDANCA